MSSSTLTLASPRGNNQTLVKVFITYRRLLREVDVIGRIIRRLRIAGTNTHGAGGEIEWVVPRKHGTKASRVFIMLSSGNLRTSTGRTQRQHTLNEIPPSWNSSICGLSVGWRAVTCPWDSLCNRVDFPELSSPDGEGTWILEVVDFKDRCTEEAKGRVLVEHDGHVAGTDFEQKRLWGYLNQRPASAPQRDGLEPSKNTR